MKAIKMNFCDIDEGAKQLFSKAISSFAEIEISENPDFLIYGVRGYDHLKYDCVKICYQTEESEPDFNLCDYAITMNELQYYDRCFAYPIYASMNDDTMEKCLKKHLLTDEEYKSKKKFCSFIYSNGNADKFRENCFLALNNYKKVDSAGRFLNNMGNADIAGSRVGANWRENKIEFMKDYRFSIAFGNTQRFGYADEKIFDAWAAGCVPVFWGDPKLKDIFNPKAFIDCTMCQEPEQVVEKVREIEEDENKYLEMQKAPIVLPNSKLFEYLDQSRLENFLKSILLQEPRQARRRSDGIFRKLYVQDITAMAKIRKTILYKLYKKIKNKF